MSGRGDMTNITVHIYNHTFVHKRIKMTILELMRHTQQFWLTFAQDVQQKHVFSVQKK